MSTGQASNTPAPVPRSPRLRKGIDVDKIVDNLLHQKEARAEITSKLENKVDAMVAEAIGIMDGIFKDMMTINGEGTDSTVSFKPAVIDALYGEDIINYRGELPDNKQHSLFEVYYGPMGGVNYYLNGINILNKKSGRLNITDMKKMTIDNYTNSALVFYIQHKLHIAVKSMSMDLTSLNFNGAVPIYSIMDYLKKNKPLLISIDRDVKYGFMFNDCKIKSDWSGKKFMIQGLCSSVSGKATGHEESSKVKVYVTMPLAGFMVKKEDLPFAEPTEKEKEFLIARGKKYFEYTGKPTYLDCSGSGIRRGYWSDVILDCRGRVMIDRVSMEKIDTDYHGYFGAKENYEFGDREVTLSSIVKGNKDQGNGDNTLLNFLTAAPFVYGYSMKAKRWVEFKIDELSDIKFSENAFCDVVLDEKIKDIIKSLVSADKINFADIISHKGLGYIFLLSGGPGTGNHFAVHLGNKVEDKTGIKRESRKVERQVTRVEGTTK